MNTQRLCIALTVANLGISLSLLTYHRTAAAAADSAVPVLRGRALEIVDDRGRLRASIKVLPAEQGKNFPETVILRLIDPNGKPAVKLGGSLQGSAVSLVGDSDATYLVLKSEGADSSLKLVSKDHKEQLIKP